MKIDRTLNKNPGANSYTSNKPPVSMDQTITVTAPTMIPARAPFLVIRFQKRLRIMTGPNAAPNPAQA
jgi:hypothetical protein